MKLFKNLLIQVSDPDQPENDIAVSRGVEIAKKTGAKITLFDVIEPPENMLSSYAKFVNPSELTELLMAQRLEQLTELAKTLQSEGLEISARVSQGKYFIEIIKAVILGKSDLLIKAANYSEKGFDSNDLHIMRKCPKPVWLIKGERPTKIHKILAAIDLSMEQHAEGRAQNRMIMNIATTLNQYDEGELTILSCWSLYGEDSLRHGAFLKISHDEVETLLSNEEREYEERLETLAKEYPEFIFDKRLIKGRPKTAIPDYVNDNNIDIVVMGTIGRSGIPGLLIGNTSESVLQAINSSVITLKPDDFVSPIR